MLTGFTVLNTARPLIKEASMTSSDNLLQYSNAAIYWHSFGFSVIPIIPGKKQSAVKWDAWLDGLSTEKIKTHWGKHPDHEVGVIVGDDVIVLDAVCMYKTVVMKGVNTVWRVL